MEEQDSQKQETEEHSDAHSPGLEDFLKSLEAMSGPDEKLQAGVAFMRAALAREGSPDFKGFWEVRKVCLPLFKDAVSPAARVQLWADFIELTREGRRLKNLLDAESAFAAQQIELAINALEEEVKGYHVHLKDILDKTPDVEFPGETKTLQYRIDFYQKLQKQLNLLNLYASRINALRKELIHTEMRIRQKNKFFQKLSQLGDQVFPPRKDLIREVSEAFVEDVDVFIEEFFSEENFDENRLRRSVFFLRAEIKNLQAIAKILTLNTHAFSSTREMLSGCWDKLKGMEKELKKEYAEHKQLSTENADQIIARIDAFLQAYQEKEMNLEEGLRVLDEISREMRAVQLTRNDVLMLKERLKDARQPLEAKQEDEANIRKQKEAEFEKARQEKVDSFKERVNVLKERAGTYDLESLSQELDEVRKMLPTLSMTKMEKQHLDRVLKTLRDQIAERQSQEALSLSDDDRATLNDLNTILQQRNERRKEVKAQIEEYRKIIGGSGLDFEKAIRFNELMEAEKANLAKIDENINEIKIKMRELK